MFLLDQSGLGGTERARGPMGQRVGTLGGHRNDLLDPGFLALDQRADAASGERHCNGSTQAACPRRESEWPAQRAEIEGNRGSALQFLRARVVHLAGRACIRLRGTPVAPFLA
nr:hypothetical protein [uncultured Caldimonas sp.]